MRRMLTPGRLLAALAGAAAGTVVTQAVRTARARRDLVAEVPLSLRHPMLYLPLDRVVPQLAWLSKRLPPSAGPVQDGVDVRTEMVTGRHGGPDLEAVLYEPHGRRRPSAALLWIHGGGYIVGNPLQGNELCSRIAAELDVLVLSPDYRLAPENRFPAALDDCMSALRSLHARAGELGIDPARIAVGGDSAGGGLAAAVAQRAHDEGVPVCFQLLEYPMLDDRTVLRADAEHLRTLAWTPPANRYGWTSYLGHEPRPAPPEPYAVPARREDLSGLPPAWIGVGTLDLFRTEDVEYARRLTEAGVPVTLHEEPGMYHGADTIVASREVPEMIGFRYRMIEQLRTAFAAQTPAPQAD